MFIIFANPDQLIQEDTPKRLTLARLNKLKFWGGLSLILAIISLVATLIIGLYLIGGIIVGLYAIAGSFLVTSRRSVIFDASQQAALFSTQFLLFESNSRAIPFAEIDKIYLDYEEYDYPAIKNVFYLEQRVRRKWFVFLTLTNAQTVTIAHHQKSYPLGQEPNLFKETRAWEKLAQKICAVSDKLLVHTPSVPSRVPRTFLDVVDQIVQRRLEELPEDSHLTNQTIRLRSHPTGSLEIIVNGKNYRDLNDVPDPHIQNLIQGAVEEWYGLNGSSKTTSLI